MVPRRHIYASGILDVQEVVMIDHNYKRKCSWCFWNVKSFNTLHSTGAMHCSKTDGPREDTSTGRGKAKGEKAGWGAWGPQSSAGGSKGFTVRGYWWLLNIVFKWQRQKMLWVFYYNFEKLTTLADKWLSDDSSWIPRRQKMAAENWLPKVVPWPPHICVECTPTYTYIYTHRMDS